MTATTDATDRSTVEQLVQIVDGLQNTVEDLQETVEQQAEYIDELEDDLADYKDYAGREFADVRARITDVENQQAQSDSADPTPGVDGDDTESQNHQTPLEQICALPEHIAERELTTNQQRARFIARDVHDYAEKAPAGLVIDSRTIKKVITAAEGTKPHTQTVARIMDFLADLGQDEVELLKRRGKKLIVIDSAVADRLVHHDRCDQGGDSPAANSVISSS